MNGVGLIDFREILSSKSDKVTAQRVLELHPTQLEIPKQFLYC